MIERRASLLFAPSFRSCCSWFRLDRRIAFHMRRLTPGITQSPVRNSTPLSQRKIVTPLTGRAIIRGAIRRSAVSLILPFLTIALMAPSKDGRLYSTKLHNSRLGLLKESFGFPPSLALRHALSVICPETAYAAVSGQTNELQRKNTECAVEERGARYRRIP